MGNRECFFDDDKLGEGPLRFFSVMIGWERDHCLFSFPRLFSMVCNKEASVKECLCWEGGFCVLGFGFQKGFESI